MAKIASTTRHFSDQPFFEYRCPSCETGFLSPVKTSFRSIEPKYSSSEHGEEDWDPHWVTYRFVFECICTKNNCGEIAFVSGSGGVSERYDFNGDSEYYDYYIIKSFVPAPLLIDIPKDVPDSVSELIKRSFSLFWCDVAAAANALRASLEALLTELNVPTVQKNKYEKTVEISLHERLEIWAKNQKDYSDLCMTLKDVGNLGSHGEIVKEELFIGVLEIYGHVLHKLYENDRDRKSVV